ncbi:MAG: DUF2867 domain-containing protein [Cytophagales bacterium]|nr:DUF2867 domain-containing protein [Rhizobacter sp.]
MPSDFKTVKLVALPLHSAVTHFYKTVNLADAFAIQLPAGASKDPDVLARFILSHQPSWVGVLTKVRDLLVAGFGLKTAKHLASLAGGAPADRAGIFKVYSVSETEIIVGEDDRHLDFRVSVFCALESAPQASRQLVVSTVVQCHNRLGRVYIFLIAPFHRMVVRASLLHAARVGWPAAAASHVKR